MKKILFVLILLSGCARNQCQLTIDNLQPVQKIPKTANIEIGDKILADEGGNILLKNYVIMSNELNSVVSNCQEK